MVVRATLVERSARRGSAASVEHLLALLVVSLTALAIVHLTLIEPNPTLVMPNVTVGALAFDLLFTAPFLLFAAALPHPRVIRQRIATIRFAKAIALSHPPD